MPWARFWLRLGEGEFKVWFKGGMYHESLEFSPYGGSMGKRCEFGRGCWGELERELKMTWWVKIRAADGRVGWTDQAERFSGKDACE